MRSPLMPASRQSPRMVPDFDGCIPMERVEDLVGCDVYVQGGVRFVPGLSSVTFKGQMHVSGIQHHDGHELYLQLPDRTFVRLTEASRITGWVRSQKVLQSVITFHDIQDLPADEQKLFVCALSEADITSPGLGPQRMAAAVLCNDTNGTLSEHPLWGDTRCPEATLLFHAKEYGRLPAVRKIAIAGPSETLDDSDPRAPCGACRQLILECQEAIRGPIAILFPGGYGQVARVENIEALLPLARL